MRKDSIFNSDKYEKTFKGSRAELKEFFRKLELKLFTNKLTVEGNNVIIPSNQELDYKIKYDIDNNYSITIKVSWRNLNPEYIEDTDENDEIDDF
jgi:hypothetical protein